MAINVRNEIGIFIPTGVTARVFFTHISGEMPG
jgi:hypothetical protein